MARGLAVPVGVGPTGRTKTIEKDEQASKIIALALGDGENDNAFQQDVSLGLGMIFKAATPSERASVLARVTRIFAEFERRKLFRLVRSSVKWSKTTEGETTLEFKYINLESDEERAFSRIFPKSGSSA